MTGCAPCRDTGAVTGPDGLRWPCQECGEHESEYTRPGGPDAPRVRLWRDVTTRSARDATVAVSEPPGQYQHLPGVSAVDWHVEDVSTLAAPRGQLTPAACSPAAGDFLPPPVPG